MHRRKWIAAACFLPLLFVAYSFRPLSHESMKQRAYLAAQKGDLKELKRLLDQGLSPNTRVRADEYWLAKMLLGEREYFLLGTPLTMVAQGNGHVSEVRYLIAHGADVNNVDAAGTTLLAGAAYANDFELVQELLAEGADPYACWKDGTSPHSGDARVQALLDDAKAHCSDRGLPCKRHRGHPSPDSS